MQFGQDREESRMKNTRLLKGFVILATAFCLSLSANAAGGKLIEMLVNDTGVLELLGKRGIKGAPAKKVSEYVSQSILSISYSNKKPAASELRKIITSIVGSDVDNVYKKQLMELLDTPAEKVTKDDLVTAVNNLIYLSNRFGKRGSTVLACAECVSEALSKHGFKFTLEVLNDKSSKRVLTQVLPREPRQLTTFISKEMSKGGLGDYSRTAARTNLVSPEEERALGLFLGLRKYGSKKQKELADAIVKVSKDSSGDTTLLSRENPHKLWKLFSEDMSDEVMDSWTKMLKEVGEKSDGSDGSAKKAFYEYLERVAGDDPVLREQLSALKRKNCFFK
ncbi:MAG: hypothetical protein CME70_00395 [Halobacteriovorax sp.]|nr:hypothetical protein [Halobacteriovorax sp.]|tara:strand:- start:24699 stop:25706 length:1008 start_codon:yes stop_codon:yes gene_type:complete